MLSAGRPKGWRGTQHFALKGHMPRKIRELKADLRRAGFSFRSGKGSHTVWYHADIIDEITISGGDGDDAKRYQERGVRNLIEKLRDAQRRQP